MTDIDIKTDEEDLFGAMMLANDTIDEISAIITEDTFLMKNEKVLYAAIITCYRKNEAVDIRILKDYLESTAQLESVGGYKYLMRLEDEVPLACNAEHYARIIQEKHIKRKIVAIGHKLLQNCNNGIASQGLLEEAEKDIIALSLKGRDYRIYSLNDLAHETLDNIETAMNSGEPIGLKT